MMDAHTYVVNVEAAVSDENRYLMIERADDEEHAAGMLAFPGGKVEAPPDTDRVIKETVTRELAEEVGITVSQVEYVCSRTFIADEGTPCINVVVLCEHETGEPKPLATDEVATVHWLTAAEIRERNPPEFLLNYIDEIEKVRGNTGD